MQELQQYRLYSCVNMYFAGIHAGIQTAHVVAEMAHKYANPPVTSFDVPATTYQTWSARDKTIVCLNGGTHKSLTELVSLCNSSANFPLPWGYFRESEEAANGCMTAFGIILPDNMWTNKVAQNAFDIAHLGDREFYNVIQSISRMGLAK